MRTVFHIARWVLSALIISCTVTPMLGCEMMKRYDEMAARNRLKDDPIVGRWQVAPNIHENESTAGKPIEVAGPYTLYRVSSWREHDIPTHTEVVGVYELRANDTIDCDWLDRKGNIWFGYKGTDLVLHLGGQSVHVGKSTTRVRYYLACADYWDAYWKHKVGKDYRDVAEGVLGLILSGFRGAV